MLVVTRKTGEEVIVGGNIRIEIIEIKGGKVRIGVVAPRDVIVDRHEIHAKRLVSSKMQLAETIAPADWRGLELSTQSTVLLEWR